MVDEARGLHSIWVRYPSEQAALGALQGAWDEPRVAEEPAFWLGEGIRAVYRGCRRTGEERYCAVELTPFRTLEDTLELLFHPDGGSWLGREVSTLPSGERSGDRARMLWLAPFDLGGGRVDLELTWSEEGVVVGTRSSLDWTDHAENKGRIERGLVDLLGPSIVQEGCHTWPEHQVRACDKYSMYVIEQGAPRD